MKPSPALRHTQDPSMGLGRVRMRYEKEGFDYDRVKAASLAKNKTEAAFMLDLLGNNRYRKLDNLYKKHKIRPHYSGRDTYAKINKDSPQSIFNQAVREANSHEHYCPSIV